MTETNLKRHESPLQLIERHLVTLIRATNEFNKIIKDEHFDYAYVEHNPKFYKLDTNNRALFTKILELLHVTEYYFAESYEIKRLLPQQRIREYRLYMDDKGTTLCPSCYRKKPEHMQEAFIPCYEKYPDGREPICDNCGSILEPINATYEIKELYQPET